MDDSTLIPELSPVPIAAFVALSESLFRAAGFPPLSPSEIEDYALGRADRSLGNPRFAELHTTHRDALVGLYLSHCNGGFSPHNARACRELLAPVASLVDEDVLEIEEVPFSEDHRGACRMQIGGSVVRLEVTPSPPQTFRLTIRTPARMGEVIELPALEVAQPDFPQRVLLALRGTA